MQTNTGLLQKAEGKDDYIATVEANNRCSGIFANSGLERILVLDKWAASHDVADYYPNTKGYHENK